MYVIQINSVDSSCHTQLTDAEVQKQRFLDLGRTNVEIIEKDSFNPPQDL